MQVCGIYKIINRNNQKYYVGSSNNIEQRFSSHRSLLERNRHPNIHLQRAWNKDGLSAFLFVIVEQTDKKTLLSCEQKYLDIAKYLPNTNYNCSFIAGKIEMTKEIREKIGRRAKARLNNPMNHPRFGVDLSQETKAKISKSGKGRKLTQETREKMKLSHIGRIYTLRPHLRGINSATFGRKHNDEERRKISCALQGKMNGSKNSRFDKTQYHFRNVVTNENFIGTRFEFYNRYHLNKAAVCMLIKGKLQRTRNWTIIHNP